MAIDAKVIKMTNQDSTSHAALPEMPPPDFSHYDENGVDLSLLRWMLSLTPLERLDVMEQHAADTLELLEYGRQHREKKAQRNR
jgi:hypothetical protein